MEEEYSDSLKKIQISADERCQKTREKTERYLVETLENQKRNDEEEMDILKDEINDLKSSLNARQKVI